MDRWQRIHHCFDTDDGSLPDMSLIGLSADEVSKLFGLLRSIGVIDASPDDAPTFWDKQRQASVRVDAVSNAAALVQQDLAEGFTMMLRQVRFENLSMPDLGVQIFQGTVCLFFRMGSEWNPAALNAFLRLLQAMKRIAPRSQFEFDQTFVDPIAFLRVWEEFNS